MIRALGRDEEDFVISYLEKKGYSVVHQKGNERFDAFIDGKKVDIKSARLTKTNNIRGKQYYSYKFELDHRQSKTNNFNIIDYYLLFFKDLGLIFKLDKNKVKVRKMLSFPENIYNSRTYTLEKI